MSTHSFRSFAWTYRLVPFSLFAACTFIVPRWWCGLDSAKWMQGARSQVAPLAREVTAIVARGVEAADFTSDIGLFQNEWMFGTYQMAALGLLQVCIEHPELRPEFLPAAEQAIDRLLSKKVRAFDSQSWGEDPLESLDGPGGHAAYLGYTNLVLALHRRVVPQSRFAELNDRISNALARRLRDSVAGILYTYPQEAYPVDNASVLGSLLLHQKYFGGTHADVTRVLLRNFQTTWREPHSGLLFQAVDGRNGTAFDAPRASGTALAAFFISFADRETGRQLFQSVARECAGSVLGFGYVREYPAGIAGKGDIDSGPVVFGVSPSGTGFTLASARSFGDRDLFVQLYRLAHLAGAPLSTGNRRQFVTGGPLGNAIMLAMLTSLRSPP